MEHFSPFQCDRKLTIRPRRVGQSKSSERTFLHADLDAFFASVEQIKNPKLKGKPVIVGGRNSRRGVVVASSYEAKRFGVKTGMPWPTARKLCSQAIFLPADFDAYAEYSEKVQKILEKMAPVVAQASVDEAYLDLTDCEKIYGTPRYAAEKIFNTVRKKTGLFLSIGIACAQSVAKIASAFAKPAGMMEVPKNSQEKFLAPLPVETMPGIGPAIGKKLRDMGIFTLGELANVSSQILEASFGIYGPFLKAKALGEDNWELEVTEVVRSIGKEKTFEEDIDNSQRLKQELFDLVAQVGVKLREKNLHARRVAVKVRYQNFSMCGASKVLHTSTYFDRSLFEVAWHLMEPWVGRQKIRLIGFSAQDLREKNNQLDLFSGVQTHKWERLYRSLDQLRGQARFVPALPG